MQGLWMGLAAAIATDALSAFAPAPALARMADQAPRTVGDQRSGARRRPVRVPARWPGRDPRTPRAFEAAAAR